MKKFQNKIDLEAEEDKKKEYYSSTEYKYLEKKKKRLGAIKTKVVSFESQRKMKENQSCLIL